MRLEIPAHPGEELRAALLLGHFDGVVQAGDAHAALRKRVDLGEPAALEHRMAAAAVGEKEDRIGVVERRGIGRPAPGVNGRHERQAGGIEALLKQQRARAVLVLARRMAGLAGDHHELLTAVGELQPLELDVFELHLHRRPDMHLKREQTFERSFVGLIVHRLRHQLPVDEVLELRPLGDDPHVIPVAGLDDFLEIIRRADRLAGRLRAIGVDRDPLAAQRENAAAPLLVENARVLRAGLEITLIATDGEWADLLELPAPILDAAVASGQAVLKPELEIVDVALAPDQKRVGLDLLVGRRLADDRAVPHAPDLGIAFPAGERPAVEERGEGGVIGRCRHSTARRDHQHGQ